MAYGLQPLTLILDQEGNTFCNIWMHPQKTLTNLKCYVWNKVYYPKYNRFKPISLMRRKYSYHIL